MEFIERKNQTIYEVAKKALWSYFLPIFYLLRLVNQESRLEKNNRNEIEPAYKKLEIQYHKKITALLVVSKAVCLNQGNYLQFSFLTAEKHRDLKDFFRADSTNYGKLAELKQKLSDYVNKGFYENAYENFKLLHAYFLSRSNVAPRICIKGNFRTGNQDEIVTVFRDSMSTYSFNSEIKQNTGFDQIYKNGVYFIENDIPNAVVNNGYKNPRIDYEKTKKYLIEGGEKAFKWRDCWTSSDDIPDSAHYKSTLIIPMTLWNNKLSKEFKNLINMENVERTIFGFLCFDHVDVNYFNEDDDVLIGYIFADIISMYIFTRIVYMESSKTFDDVEKHLDNQNISIETRKLLDYIKSIPESIDLENLLKDKITTTKNNGIYTMDNNLFNFIQPDSA